MTISWNNLYSEKWGNILTPESVSHPAKMSRGLVFKIYEYALEMDYIKPGDTVLDCFGGVGCTALPALMHGINWVGNELEPFFVDCARGCDCTGISKEDYRRFYGRWRRVAYKDGRHWCPACTVQAERSVLSTVLPLSNASKKRRAQIAELEARLKEQDKSRQSTLVNRIPFPELFQHIPQQFDMFGVYVLEASYSRNSQKIPYTEPHHYSGNLENWRKYAKGGAVARCYQGDSRFLSSILGQVEVVVSSPPYIDTIHKGQGGTGDTARIDKRNDWTINNGYGLVDGQLGSMPAGEYDSIISSPPFNSSLANRPKNDNDTLASFGRKSDGSHRGGSVVTGDYGNSDSQLANLPDTGYDAVISSSPFVSSLGSDNPDKRGGLFRDDKRRNDANLTGTYGDDEANLGTMAEGEFSMVVSSPPFADNLGSGGKGHTGVIPPHNSTGYVFTEYGSTDGQLGSLPDKDYDLVIGSPSWAGNSGGQGDASRNAIDPRIFDACKGGMKKGTGSGVEGNIDHMSEGDYSAVIGSPPFEDSGSFFGAEANARQVTVERVKKVVSYGQTPNQLGNQSGVTFWAASKDILLETNKVLRKGGYTFWVVKRYIKAGRVVDFPDMWKRLCEVCGFEHVETIHAWQTEDKGTQVNLEGEAEQKIVRRQSFFRLLYTKKYPENAIDFETVLVLRKL